MAKPRMAKLTLVQRCPNCGGPDSFSHFTVRDNGKTYNQDEILALIRAEAYRGNSMTTDIADFIAHDVRATRFMDEIQDTLDRYRTGT
jgi:hypothetical protein